MTGRIQVEQKRIRSLAGNFARFSCLKKYRRGATFLHHVKYDYSTSGYLRWLDPAISPIFNTLFQGIAFAWMGELSKN
jgi:hypothetical protein